jgi:chromosome segregation ATPase
MGIQITAKILSAILTSVDNSRQKQIENEQKHLDELVEKYEELEESIEKAYDQKALNEYYDNVLSNLDEQEKALERIIKLEESRGKKKDEDNIEEAKKELKELEKTRTEILEETASDLGAIYDVRDATQDFVNAWLDAFQETGNGLKGLKENFKETFKDIMLQQAVMTGAGAIMKPLFDEINTALENDFVVDDTEYKNINKIADDQLGALDSFLTSFYEKYPDVFEAASELSGLQAGIEGITEQQAEVISAYLNSIRFFVHSIDENTKLLAEQGLTSSNMVNKLAQATNEFTSSSSQQDENPMLSQLQMLVEQTKAINDLLGSVTRHGHTKGGYGLKVFID